MTITPIQFKIDIDTWIDLSFYVSMGIIFHLFSKSFIEDSLIPRMLKFGQKHLDILDLKPFEMELSLYNSMKYKTIQMLNVLHYERLHNPEQFKEFIYKRVSKYAIVNIIPLLIMNGIIKRMFKD